MRTRAGAPLAIAVLLSLTGLARAQIEEPADEPPPASLPNAHWLTLETPHFEIHYYPEEGAFAERAAHYGERAYRLITRYLDWRPSGRVSMTLMDHVDTANGDASSLPYNFIHAYAVPPDNLDELSDFDDYVKLLVTHEFTHVVHLDTILSWCPRLLNTIFGKMYAPNLSQPTWFIEGLAVLMESRHTTAGRVRSTFFDMHLRVPFLEGRLLSLDKVTAIPLEYPEGTAAYLYGSSLLRYVEDIYGPEKIREISHRYGDECIAGGLNRVTGRAVGRGYAEVFGEGLWEAWRRSLSHKFTLEAEEVSSRGVRAGRRFTWDAPSARGQGPTARFFADGSLVYYRVNDNQAPSFVRIDPATGARHVLSEMLGAGPLSPTPDGRALVFQRVALLPIATRIASSAHLAMGRPLPARPGKRNDPTAHARLPRPRARRFARRRADRVRARGPRRPAVGGAPHARRHARHPRRRHPWIRLYAGVFARQSPHRLLALEARRFSRHSPLRPRDGEGPAAVGRSGHGRRPALHAGRPVLAVLVGSHRDLRHLRVRACDGEPVSGDERARRRVPAGGLARWHPPRVRRVFVGRVRPLRDAVRSLAVPGGPAVCECAAGQPHRIRTTRAIPPMRRPKTRRPCRSRSARCPTRPGSISTRGAGR